MSVLKRPDILLCTRFTSTARRLLIITTILAGLLQTGCDSVENSPPVSTHHTTAHLTEHDAQFYIFGTEVALLLRGIDADRAEQLFATVNDELMQFHHAWHPWQPGELEDLNQAIARGDSGRVSERTLNMLQQARQLSAQSQGYFNPAIGGLIRLWGFHTDRFPITTAPPDPAAIDEWLRAKPVMDDLVLDDVTVSSSNPHVRLDVSGFAKGFAVDRVIEMLRHEGVPAALVNAGGDLRGYGEMAQPWRIAIRDPVGGDVLAGVTIKGDEAIFTSGNYIRFKQYDGHRFSHILDASTGYPVDHIISATVIAANGGVADAAATALAVSGESALESLMSQMNLSHVLLIDESGCAHLDRRMLQRIEWVSIEPECLNIF